jgi:hypothetical protein
MILLRNQREISRKVNVVHRLKALLNDVLELQAQPIESEEPVRKILLKLTVIQYLFTFI